ncbi:hypothetical protein Agub_g14141, partial [Astrephomene gubernaculifera]
LTETMFRLTSSGKHSAKVRAYDNPAYDAPTSKPGEPGDAAITVQPAVDADLTEVVFPSSRNMLRRMTYQLWAVYLLIVAHAMVTAYTDPIYMQSPLTQVIVYGSQGGLLIAIIMAFFVLTSQTLLIQLGRYDLYLREFAALYGVFALALALCIAIKVYSAVLILRRVSYLAMWDMPAYTALWAVHRVVLLLFWVAAALSATAVFNTRYFDPDMLLRRDRQAAGSGQQGAAAGMAATATATAGRRR